MLAVVYRAVRELLDADARPAMIAVEQRDLGAGEPGYGPYLGTIPDFGGKPGTGVLIQGVRKGSPAEIAGLRAGDRIIEFDGVAIANLEEYAALLFGAHAGQRVVIVVVRDGRTDRRGGHPRAAALMFVVYGAGAVGLVVGARLARAGLPVLLVTRRPEAARRIHELGVRIEDLRTGQRARAARRGGLRNRGRCRADREPAGALLHALARHGRRGARARRRRPAGDGREPPERRRQRGDARGELRARDRRLRAPDEHAHGRQLCRVRWQTAASCSAPGLRGTRLTSTSWRTRLRRAGYDVGVSTRILEDKWLKLCVNLMSAPNALIRREDHATRAFVELKARLLEEARAILLAAGIRARSCDGRDRSLEQEIAHQRESLALGTSARALPVYNQVWAALRHGGPVEADRYHRRLLALAAAHGVAAPQNARVLEALERAVRDALGPESLAAADLLV